MKPISDERRAELREWLTDKSKGAEPGDGTAILHLLALLDAPPAPREVRVLVPSELPKHKGQWFDEYGNYYELRPEPAPPAPTGEEQKEMLEYFDRIELPDSSMMTKKVLRDKSLAMAEQLRALILSAPKVVSRAQLPADLAMIQMEDSVEEKCRVLAKLYELKGIAVEPEEGQESKWAKAQMETGWPRRR